MSSIFTIRHNNLAKASDENLTLFGSDSNIAVLSSKELDLIHDKDNIRQYGIDECINGVQNQRIDFHSKYTYFIISVIKVNQNYVTSDHLFIYLTGTSLLVVDDNENILLKEFMNKLPGDKFIEKYEDIDIQTVFLALIDVIIEHNKKLIKKIENNLEKLEERVLADAKKECSKEIIAQRKLIMHLKHKIEPLDYIVQLLSDNENNLLSEKSMRLLKTLSYKTTKMVDEATLLRDYATQVREAFEAETDIKTNELMKIFTIITSIFLPLSLIVGWYGMNFSMPELTWKYGYTYIIAVSVAVIGLLMIYFKRKKWL